MRILTFVCHLVLGTLVFINRTKPPIESLLTEKKRREGREKK